MRLTLRTLLASMNNALQPEDAREIKKRIDESESATNLLHRTRDVMRRLRIDAPSVMDQKGGLDANTVAEYLDHTLADERVRDFEEVCFTSDVQLAEVASCHHILAMVLGEPAQVDPESRQRMYALHHTVVAERLPNGPADQTPTPDQMPQPQGESPESLPVTASGDIEPPVAPPRAIRPPAGEYLRRGRERRRILPTALAVAVVVLLGVVTLAGLGQFRPGTPLGDMLGFAPSVPPTAQAPIEPEESPTIPTPTIDEPAAAQEPAESSYFPDSVVEPEPFLDPATSSDVPAAGSGFGPMPSEPPEQPLEPVAPAPRVVGAFESDDQILLRFDPQSGSWRRLASPIVLFTQDRLLSWPAGAPLFTLEGGIQVQLIDGVRVVLSPSDEEGIGELLFDHGRLLIAGEPNPSEPGAQSRLRLRIGGVQGVITFQSPQSVAAVEVVRLPGSWIGPELEPRPLSVSLLTWNGSVSWQSTADRQPVVIEPMTLISLTAQPSEVISLQRLPDWISDESADTFGPGYMDRVAYEKMEKEISPESAVLGQLRELTLARQVEVRGLAQRCLGWVGDFEPLVAALNLPETSTAHVDALRQAIARNPQTAMQVRQALERRYGHPGTALYEMLWRLDSADARPEDLVGLVEYLDHEDLAFRRLGFQNLWNATNQTFEYRPEATVNERRTPTRRWRDWAQASSPPDERPVQEEALLPARPAGF